MFKRILYELRSQPVIATVTVVGTALALFLIMVVVMLQQVKIMPVEGESARPLLLYVSGSSVLCTKPEGGNSGNSSLSGAAAHRLTDSIPGAHSSGVASTDVELANVTIPGSPVVKVDTRQADAGFFDVFDLRLLQGRTFTPAEVASTLSVAVITEEVARRMLGTVEGAVGRELFINDMPYTVVGVVADVSPVADHAYSQIWLPLQPDDPTSFWTPWNCGDYYAVVRASDASQMGQIADEIRRREAMMNTEFMANNPDNTWNIEGAPYTQEEEICGHGGGLRPDVSGARRKQWMLYAILLLIPAINLSSMTQSRLRRRVGEIGVRRAFGSTRRRIVADVITENFFITLIGAVIGLLACVIFGSLMFDAVYDTGLWTVYNVPVTVGFATLMDWRIFAYALLFCFVLNLLSSGIPALRAARVNPVEAINVKVN